jgi:hypothetical protein
LWDGEKNKPPSRFRGLELRIGGCHVASL